MSYPPRKCEKCRAIGLSHGVFPIVFELRLMNGQQLEIHWQIEGMVCRHCKWSAMDDEALRTMQKAITKITRVVQVPINLEAAKNQ